MRLRGKGATLIGTEGSCPPLPYLEVEDAEAASLIERGLAVEYSDEPEAVQESGDNAPAATSEPVVAEASPAASATAEAVVGEDEEGPHGDVQETPEEDERLTAIVEHIEALTEDDFVKTGARAGKPKVKPLADALGWSDLTVEEVDAAFAKREAGE